MCSLLLEPTTSDIPLPSVIVELADAPFKKVVIAQGVVELSQLEVRRLRSTNGRHGSSATGQKILLDQMYQFWVCTLFRHPIHKFIYRQSKHRITGRVQTKWDVSRGLWGEAAVGTSIDFTTNMMEHMVCAAEARDLLSDPNCKHLWHSSHHLFHTVPIDVIKQLTIDKFGIMVVLAGNFTSPGSL